MDFPDYTHDRDRLAALESFAILDTPPEKGFDDIVELTRLICETPVALVSFVTDDRQWFKARLGLDDCQTDLQRSVCAHALIEPDLLVVPDLAVDDRTKQNPLVTGEPFIRFYAGAPLRTAEGHVLGSLCAIDLKPRPQGLSAAQASALRILGRQVVAQLELRRAVAQRDRLLIEQKGAEIRRNGLLEIGDRLRDAANVAEITRAATAVIGQTLGVGRAAFGRFDETAEYVDIEPDWTAEGVESAAGRHRIAEYGDKLLHGVLRGETLVISDVTTDPATAGYTQPLRRLDIRSLVNVPVVDHGRTVAMLIVHAHEPRNWSPETLTYLRNIADRVEMGIARLRAEAQQRLLNHELSHRMKNTMALVQAVASQTLKNVSDKAAVQAFSDRLLALSMAHDVLLQQDWQSAQVLSIVESAICIFDDVGRFDVAGDKVTLGSRSALSLALLLHELTTNAVKYGALSNDSGRVHIGWAIEQIGGEDVFRLRWRETGGPAVAPPTRQGFGSRLLKMGLTGTGDARLHYLTSGVEAEFAANVVDLQS